jgi:cytoskeletal protein CcmA (bactofilin family)
MIWKKTEPEETTGRDQAQPQPAPGPSVRAQPQPARERALIGPSIEIKGDLSGTEDLFIEGRIEGKIELRKHSVTVGKNGRVKADIIGCVIVVLGEVDGNLYGEEQIVLRSSSRVKGNLFASRVTLEDGAQFRGSVEMTAKPPAGSDPAQAQEPSSEPVVQPPGGIVEED